MRKTFGIVIALSLWTLGNVAAADIYGLPVTEHTLKNGMRFLIVERRESPTFSAVIRFKVGSVNEVPGQTGLAHLLEHMMFKGTSRFGTTDPVDEQPVLQQIDAIQRQIQFARASGQETAALEREAARLEQQAKRFVIRNELWDIYRRNGGTGLNASTSRDESSTMRSGAAAWSAPTRCVRSCAHTSPTASRRCFPSPRCTG